MDLKEEMSRAKRGRFLVIEGGHGTGKTTLAKSLKRSLVRKGYLVSLSEEPFSDEMIKVINKYPKHFEPNFLHCIILADRFLHVEYLERKLATNDLVISTRYVPSSLVYQRISGIRPSVIKTLNADFLKPDKMVILHSTLERRVKRMRERPESFFINKKNLEREQRYYSEICREMKGNKNTLIVDAAGSKSQVLEEVLSFLNLD